MHGKEYEEYLKSPEWQYKRLQKARQAKYTCEICGKIVRKGFHIHHKTYKHFKNEPLEDLEFLCEDCHMDLHYDKNAKSHIKGKKQVKEPKSCNNCYYSEIVTYKRAKGYRDVLFCQKYVKECNRLCRAYRKGAYKEPFVKPKKKKKKKVKAPKPV